MGDKRVLNILEFSNLSILISICFFYACVGEICLELLKDTCTQ